MTTPREGFQLMLAGAPTFSALLQDPDGVRVFPDVTDEDRRLPYSTWVKVTEPTHRHMAAPAGLGEAHYQVDLWGNTPEEVEALALALRADLDHTTGTYGTLHVRRVFVVDERDRTEEKDDGSGDVFWNVQLDLVVWYVRP